ncbi:MAG: Sulfate transport system permease protein CysT [Planctomycetota bacterium]|jgi:sulfate transport system permease protein
MLIESRSRKPVRLPGFGLPFGITLAYIFVMIVIPIVALLVKASSIASGELWATLASPRVQAALRLTFGASLAAAMVNLFFGSLVAWTLVRYRFFGRKILDALVDLPFAMPTAVSGIALMAIYAPTGIVGKHLLPWGIKTAISPLGVTIALIFIGFPFVVRTMQPAIEDLDTEAEQAAAILGANRLQTFLRVTFPSLLPSALTGFTLALARALGEYGSVIFIAGNLPMKTEIASLLIVNRLDENDVSGASAIAIVMLASTLALLLAIQGLQWYVSRRTGRI